MVGLFPNLGKVGLFGRIAQMCDYPIKKSSSQIRATAVDENKNMLTTGERRTI